jgi:predicted P-loop ATPase
MLIAHYESAQDNTPASIDVSWGELVEMLTSHEPPTCAAPGFKSVLGECAGRDCKAKYGPAWSPVDIEGPRANANVRAVTAAVFDLDHITEDEINRIDKDIEDAGVAAVLHSTHSHTPPDDWCLRLVLQLARPVLPAEWPKVRAAMVERFKLPADEATKDLSRIFFLPTYRDGIDPVTGSVDGKPVDVDELLANRPEPAIEPTPQPAPVDLQVLRNGLLQTRRSKAHGGEREKAQSDVLGRVLGGMPLADSGARDATLLRALGLIVYHTPVGTPWEAILEIVRPSILTMDCEPEGIDHWIEQARQKFDRVVRARAAADARRAADDAAVRELAKTIADKPVSKPVDVSDWESLLLVDKDGLRVCERNTQLLLANAPELRGTIRFNDVTKAIEVRGGPLAGVAVDVLDSAAAGWLQTHREYFAGANAVGREIAFVARQATYDPLAEYLNELAWDGVPRVESFLEHYFGAEPTPYVRTISKRWLVGLVARALKPGCEVQNVLILEGAQGVGKTRALRALAGDYYLGTAVHIGEKDFLQLISSAWLVELGELASLKRAETDRVKQFIDQKSDKFRAPYGRTPELWERRCVFVGTTNESDYLRDRTGNRRYWPVRVGDTVYVVEIARDRDQIFAEAVAMFVAGERWWLEGDEIPAAAAEAEDRMESSPVVEEAVARWWFGQEPGKRPASFSTLDVAEQALHISVERVDRGMQTQIGQAITNLGFAKVRRYVDGRRTYVYEASDELLSAQVRPRGQIGMLSVVAGAKSNAK